MGTYSSAENVGSNDDLLTEILLRLPVMSLLRFKSVSKHYFSLISNPSFTLLYTRYNPKPPSAPFVPVPINTPYLDSEFVQFDIENPVKPPFVTPNVDSNVMRIDIEDECNGILICCSECSESIDKSEETTYYICNPTINQFASLPKFEFFENSRDCGVTLVFDPLKSPGYKVVYVCCFGLDRVRKYQVGIYSSETGTCKPSFSFELGAGLYMHFGSGVYWKNAVHWLSQRGFVLYFDMDDAIVHKIQTPFAHAGLSDDFHTSYLFESRNQLLLVETDNTVGRKFKIHELKSDYSGWTVKYHVDLMGVVGPFPGIINYTIRAFQYSVLSLVLGEKEDESFLVLELPRKAVRYNFLSNTVHKLHDFPLSPPQGVFRRWPCVFKFAESLCSV